MELFTVQIFYEGEWHFGSEFCGCDTVTGVVGGYFSGTLERAQDHMRETAKYRIPNTTRIVRAVLDSEPISII